MTLLHITPQDHVVSRWSGGTTAQIAIAPRDAQYGGRDFLWRVSSARVELAESDFTALPDYWRWITPLSGTMTLSHDGGEPVTLAPYQVHAFDGGAATRSRGQCTDFNLMLRKGRGHGALRSLRLAAGDREELASPGPGSWTALLLFCGQGQVTVTGEGRTAILSAGEAVLSEGPGSLRLTAEKETVLLAAEMWG